MPRALPDNWRDLYLMLGTSSAALVGLLFVAASLHLSEIANEEVYRLRVQYTTLILVSTLLMATAILVPQPLPALGAELLVINLWGLSFPIALLRQVLKIPNSRGRGGFSVRRGAQFISGYVIGVAGSTAVVVGYEWGMYLVTLCYANCMIASIWNAWMIMLGIARGERKRH
ncbi:MAG TPA: hypothetical protein VMI47_00130 [Pseudolabrys sp.]|nr:hypothetical protein [Pseudolabrys sp.]